MVLRLKNRSHRADEASLEPSRRATCRAIGSETRGSALMRKLAQTGRRRRDWDSDAIRLHAPAHTTRGIRGRARAVRRADDAAGQKQADTGGVDAAASRVHNQRFEPIFDRYPLSGRTYTTASGTTVRGSAVPTTAGWSRCSADASTSPPSVTRLPAAAISRSRSAIPMAGRRRSPSSGRTPSPTRHCVRTTRCSSSWPPVPDRWALPAIDPRA